MTDGQGAYAGMPVASAVPVAPVAASAVVVQPTVVASAVPVAQAGHQPVSRASYAA